MSSSRAVPDVVAALVLLAGLAAAGERQIPAGPLRIEVVATAPRVVRKVTGEVTARVAGVPAEPVDSFCWDGDGVTPAEGRLYVLVDPAAEKGVVRARWTDAHGEWTVEQVMFHHPEHRSGVRVGRSADTVEPLINEGIIDNVYLHGDSAAGTPTLPTLFAYLGAWGMVKVTLDGKPFENPFGWPGPGMWHGHLMVTEGVRHPDGSVRTGNGGIYDASKPAEGAVERGDLEAHISFSDERYPETKSYPSLYSFYYNVEFEDVAIRVIEAEEPIPVAADDPLIHRASEP